MAKPVVDFPPKEVGLGGSGRGVVYKAEDTRLRRFVALDTSAAIITVKVRKSDT